MIGIISFCVIVICGMLGVWRLSRSLDKSTASAVDAIKALKRCRELAETGDVPGLSAAIREEVDRVLKPPVV